MAEENPYESPVPENSRHFPVGGEHGLISVWRCLFFTAITAMVSSVPLAGIIGLLFRFPVPFAGYVSGPAAFFAAMFAAFFYSVVGGVIVQAIAGFAGGLIAYKVTRRHPERMRIVILLCGMASALPGLLLLSMLDWIVGPW